MRRCSRAFSRSVCIRRITRSVGPSCVIDTISPEYRRAEVVSSYYVAGFAGNSLPVIGVGVLSGALGSVAAGAIFATTIGAFAIVALVFGARHSPAR